MPKKPEPKKPAQGDRAEPAVDANEGWYRNRLALGVTVVSIVGILIIGGVVILVSGEDTQLDSARLVLAGVLPLFGAWVGTVLAYYFSRENFEAATRSVSEMARRLTSAEVLASIPVKEVMIRRDEMATFELPADQLLLADALEKLKDEGKGERLPILTPEGLAKHVIHRSLIDRYLTDQAFGGKTKTELAALTLKDFLTANPELSKKSFITVKADDSLAVAKEALEEERGIQDVIVTTTGNADGTVVGWVTNNIISKHSWVGSR